MRLETALNEFATPNRPVTIEFQIPGEDDSIIQFANLKHALSQRALIAKYEFVTSVGNSFIAK